MREEFRFEGGAGRVLVLNGGCSAERDVSLASGAAVAAAIEASGHSVRRLDPAVTDLRVFEWLPGDVAFIALHGAFGEDGQVQDLLDSRGVRYTGSDSAASRLAFSKSAAKVRFRQCNVPTPAYALFHASDSDQRVGELADRVGYPLVVKPDAQGSSLGVTLVCVPEDLESAVRRCLDFGPFGLLERAVIGTEWTLAVLDDAPLPLIQIGTSHTLFDFEAKYQDDATTYAFEFPLPESVVKLIVEAGQGACAAVGTSGIARVDLRLDESLQPWVLEVNTIPGMTDHSLVPKAAARLGLSLGALCERAIQSALRRHAGRKTVPNVRIPHNRAPWRHAG